jgi:hypothetical protein
MIPGPFTYLRALNEWMLLLLSPLIITAWLTWMLVALIWLLVKWLIVMPLVYGHRRLKERQLKVA